MNMPCVRVCVTTIAFSLQEVGSAISHRVNKFRKGRPTNLSFAVHLPLVGAFISVSMEGPVETAIVEWNEEVLHQNESNGMWKRRAEYFRQAMGYTV